MKIKPDIRKLIQYQGHNGAIYCMADLPDSTYFLSAGGDGWIVQWSKDGASTDGVLMAKVDGKIFAMHHLSVHKMLLAGDFDGDLYWINLHSNEVVRRVRHHKGSIFAIDSFMDAVYTVGADGYLVQWSSIGMMPVLSVKISLKSLRTIVIDQSNGLAYIGSSDAAVYIVDLNTMAVIKILKNLHENSVFTVSLADGQYLFSGGRDAQLQKTSLEDFSPGATIPAHWYTINDLLYLHDADLLVSASRDKSFRIWNATDLSLVRSVDMHKGGHINSVNTLLYFADKKILATGSDDRTVILWELTF